MIQTKTRLRVAKYQRTEKGIAVRRKYVAKNRKNINIDTETYMQLQQLKQANESNDKLIQRLITPLLDPYNHQ